MHIAVCDDNVADRKQLERLLGRESDKRKADTGVFYTDSFGDSNALIRNPMSYDLFFLDLTEGEQDGFSIACRLREIGVTAPIVLCSSKINYLEKDTLGENESGFMHLTKPILTDSLSRVLDRSIHLQKSRVSTIELRSEKETLYVQEDEIIYAVSSGLYVNVYLRNKPTLSILTTMDNFCSTVSMFPHMLQLTEKSMINIAYLDTCSPFKAVLKDGTAVKSSPLSYKYLKIALQEYRAEQD